VSDVLKINPIQYHWNATSGMEQGSQYTGFSAQNVQAAIPEAVAVDARGYLTLAERPILATVVNALKEIWNKITGHDSEIAALKNRISVLEAQAGIANSTQAAVPSATAPAETLDTTAPVITLTPIEQTITTGTSWSSVGVSATDASSLATIKAKIVGDTAEPVDHSQLVLDTSAIHEYQVEYSVTDVPGNTGTAIRVVKVTNGTAALISEPIVAPAPVIPESVPETMPITP
jgi:hypothetical protein